MADIKNSEEFSVVKSADVLVFPTATRTYTSDGQYITEYNLANVVNRLTDTDAFVVTRGTTGGQIPIEDPFEFNMYGYYIKLTRFSDITTPLDSKMGDGDYLVAVMGLERRTDDSNVWRIVPPRVFSNGNEDAVQKLDSDPTNIADSLFYGITFEVVHSSSVEKGTSPLSFYVEGLKVYDYGYYDSANSRVLLVLAKKRGEYYYIPSLSKIKFRLDDGEVGALK